MQGQRRAQDVPAQLLPALQVVAVDPHPSVQGIALEESAAPGRLERFGMPESLLHLLRLDAGEGVLRPVELEVLLEPL